MDSRELSWSPSHLKSKPWLPSTFQTFHQSRKAAVSMVCSMCMGLKLKRDSERDAALVDNKENKQVRTGRSVMTWLFWYLLGLSSLFPLYHNIHSLPSSLFASSSDLPLSSRDSVTLQWDYSIDEEALQSRMGMSQAYQFKHHPTGLELIPQQEFKMSLTQSHQRTTTSSTRITDLQLQLQLQSQTVQPRIFKSTLQRPHYLQIHLLGRHIGSLRRQDQSNLTWK